jgi:SMI1 / KNR4 family (SUKH-1)
MGTRASSVLSYWDSTGTPYLRGVKPNDLESFERRYGVAAPAPFRELYLTTNGTSVDGSRGVDPEGYSFFELAQVAPDPEYPWAFVFADFMDYSYAYAIDLKGQDLFPFPIGSIYIVGGFGKVPILVAKDLNEFLELYVSEDERMYQTAARKYADQMLDGSHGPLG